MNINLSDTIISFIMKTPGEMATYLAQQARSERLRLNFTQKTLSKRSGVSYSVIKKFEQTGKISLESLLKLSLVLDSLDDFELLFSKKSKPFLTLKDLEFDHERQRGRL